jgi:triosephosphate isomerase
MAQEEINGVLVGGASLDPVSFAKIVNYLQSDCFLETHPYQLMRSR